MDLRTENTFRDSPKTLRIDKTGTSRNSQEKGRTAVTTKEIESSE